MSEERDISVYLDDIIDAAGKAVRFVEGLSFSDFESDERTLYAVVRALEILGEAAKNVPQATRGRAPQIPWQDMAGMRDKLIHAYHGVDLRVVWRTVRDDLPDTIEATRLLRRHIEDAGGFPGSAAGEDDRTE